MDTETKKSIPSWLKTAVPAVVIAAVFGIAGYFVTPRNAQSALHETEQGLEAVQYRLDQAVADQKKLNKRLSDTKVELASALEQAVTSAEATETEKAKVATAEEAITQLNAKLDRANTAQESLLEDMTEAKKLAADRQRQIDQANKTAENFATDLSVAQADKQELDEANSALRDDCSMLTTELASQRQTSDELKRFVAVLDMGEQQTDQSETATPLQQQVEMPITVGELIRRMGYPSLIFQRNDYVEMKWDDKHIAWSINGLVTHIDGEAATRASLSAAAVVRPTAKQLPASWKVAQGSKVHYADLVEMFGKPDSVAGTGGKLYACWSVGAWARRVSATVVNGVVTQFAGTDADGATCCELIRQRTVAYKTAGKSVHANSAASTTAYNRAVTVVERKLSEQSNVKNRADGAKLAKWKMAPLESVGTWVGQANASAGSTTVRAWVDCTWADSDGSTTVERQYVVVTLFGKDHKTASAECTFLAPQD